MLFINLLNTREFITRKEVADICGIGTRSFYRYINLLSEINVPIFFDRTVKGYRLSTQISKQHQPETINEIIIQLISLIKYSKTIENIHFKVETDFLVKKIISLSTFSIDEVLNAYINQFSPNSYKTNEEDILKSILIDIAIANSFAIFVTYQKIDSEVENTIKVENPRLEYKEDWQLSDRLNTIILPLKTIKHVKIL